MSVLLFHSQANSTLLLSGAYECRILLYFDLNFLKYKDFYFNDVFINIFKMCLKIFFSFSNQFKCVLG